MAIHIGPCSTKIIKIEEEYIGNIWFQQDPVFGGHIISRRADVVGPPRSCDLTPCYTDKPKTIDALKDNIREAIGEIQLHTIDNVFKNRRLLHGQPIQPFK